MSDIETILSPHELSRYSRHFALPEFGPQAQRKLKESAVLCVGAGGLGSPAALYLAAAGLGRLGLVDPDRVDRSNLQRQILHGESDVNRRKVDSARETLLEINPHLELETEAVRLSASNAESIASRYDLILDGTDNFETRYLTNDLCFLLAKPNVYGSIFRFEGQLSVFMAYREGPCYRCLFPDPPESGSLPSCAESGVLGVLPGIIGSMQALEAIKILTSIGTPMVGRLIHFDALQFRFREVKLRKDPECQLCGSAPSIRTLQDIESPCGAGLSAAPSIGVSSLQEQLERGVGALLDVRETAEWQHGTLPNSTFIPIGELAGRINELPQQRPLFVFCRSGARSAKAVGILEQQGIRGAVNVTGGLLAWKQEIDPTLPVY